MGHPNGVCDGFGLGPPPRWARSITLPTCSACRLCGRKLCLVVYVHDAGTSIPPSSPSSSRLIQPTTALPFYLLLFVVVVVAAAAPESSSVWTSDSPKTPAST